MLTALCWAVLAAALTLGYSWLRATDRRKGRR